MSVNAWRFNLTLITHSMTHDKTASFFDVTRGFKVTMSWTVKSNLKNKNKGLGRQQKHRHVHMHTHTHTP